MWLEKIKEQIRELTPNEKDPGVVKQPVCDVLAFWRWEAFSHFANRVKQWKVQEHCLFLMPCKIVSNLNFFVVIPSTRCYVQRRMHICNLEMFWNSF